MPDGSVIDLKVIQAVLADAFQKTGEHEFMNACNQLNSITGVEQMLRDRSSSASKESMHVKSACEAGYTV